MTHSDSETCGPTHNNYIHLPKNNQSSISSHSLRARINDYNLSKNRSVLDRDNVRFSDDDNYWGGLNIGNYKNDEESDDEIDSKQSNYNDCGNVSVASNERNVNIVHDEKYQSLNVKVTEKNQANRFHSDKDIKDITHEINDLSLSDENKQLWSDSFRRTHAKCAVVGKHTKDTRNEVICSERSNVVDGFDNLSDSIFEEIDVNSRSLRLHTRSSIRPRVMQSKEKQPDESISKSNVVDRSTDVTDHVLKNRALSYRDSKVVALFKLRDTVVKDKKLETLRQPKEVRFKNNNLTKFEEDEKENTESNKIPREKCSSGRATVTSSLLLRKLHMYDKMYTKYK